MKIHIQAFLFAFWALLLTNVLAWEKEDHEIFDLVSELESAEGTGTTFYSFLEVSPTASHAEISKAFRKKSIQLHPDKNPGVKGIHERFARLSVIADILKGEESRKRYDFFHQNGVPKWRGTNYYYSRFRPGLGTVLSFLVLLSSALQYTVQRINYTKDLARIKLITDRARKTAWGPKLIPVSGKRKVRINLGEEHDEDGDVVGSKFLDMVVDERGVYLLEPNGELRIVDASTAVKPAISNTWFVSLLRQPFAAKTVDEEDSNSEEEQSEGVSSNRTKRTGRKRRR